MKGKIKFTVLIDAAHQVDVWADGLTVENQAPEPYIRFWNEVPGDRESGDCDDVAHFVLANIVGYIDTGTQ